MGKAPVHLVLDMRDCRRNVDLPPLTNESTIDERVGRRILRRGSILTALEMGNDSTTEEMYVKPNSIAVAMYLSLVVRSAIQLCRKSARSALAAEGALPRNCRQYLWFAWLRPAFEPISKISPVR